VRVPSNDPIRTFAPLLGSLTAAVTDTIGTGWYLQGERTRRFEAEFAAYVGAAHCVGVANGTDALELALRALGVGAGDGVVTVTNAGGYTLTACAAIGATPVFVDIDPTTLTIDLGATIRAVASTPGVRAVVATHLFGYGVDIGELRARLDAAGRAEVSIVEDAAQAHGCVVDGGRVGSLGDAACFSFYPTKNLGAIGDAGAVTTGRDDVAERLAALHQYGWTQRYVSSVAHGRNSRIDEIQAAALSVALGHLDGWNDRRRSIVERYSAAAPASVDVVHGRAATTPRFVAHLAIARTSDRNGLVDHLEAHDVATGLHYPVLDTEVAWIGDIDHVEHPTTHARQARDEIVTLPCFPGLTDAEIDHVCTALRSFVPVSDHG